MINMEENKKRLSQYIEELEADVALLQKNLAKIKSALPNVKTEEEGYLFDKMTDELMNEQNFKHLSLWN